MAEFILETENRLGRETRPQAKNSSNMNPVMDEFAFSNFSVYFFVKTDEQKKTGNSSYRRKIETKSFALSPREKTETRKAATFSG